MSADAPVPTTARNEATKLSAAFVNTCAGAFFAAGVVAPLVAYFYGFGGLPPAGNPLHLGLGVAIWLGTAAALHFIARRILRSLRS